jgi:hypothetical protein
MLNWLQNYNGEYDRDPDTADGMPTYEIFIDNPDLSSTSISASAKVMDADPEALQRRTPLRQQQLRDLTQPILDEIITPFVRQRYPEICSNHKQDESDEDDNRLCTPCYSLIRRYRQWRTKFPLPTLRRACPGHSRGVPVRL